MTYAFPLWPQPSVGIAGRADRFPVRRIYCVGRNYAAHAREMGMSVPPEVPIFFMKSADSVVEHGGTVAYPPLTSNLHHEVELVVAIGRGGRDIPADTALDHVFGYAVGIDLTRRDLQAAAKRAGEPWDMAKSFDQAAPCGPIAPAAAVGHPRQGVIALEVNGSQRQHGELADMIWPVAEIIRHLSRFAALAAGDLIYTGTPEGVGPLVRGDRVTGRVDGVGSITVTIV